MAFTRSLSLSVLYRWSHPFEIRYKLFEKLKAPGETPALVRETDGVLTEAFQAVDSQATDKLRENLLEIARLNAIINQLQNDNQWANNEIELLRKPFRVQLKAKLKAFFSS